MFGYILHNFSMMLIILYIYAMTVICINILPFISDNLYSLCTCLQDLQLPEDGCSQNIQEH